MAYRIGIDAGGTKTAYGLFDEGNALVDREQHPTPIDADGPAFCALVIDGVERILARNGLRKEDVEGVGVCMPSFILYDEGYIYMTTAMVNIRDSPCGTTSRSGSACASCSTTTATWRRWRSTATARGAAAAT